MAQAPSSNPAAPPQQQGGGSPAAPGVARILVVDDNTDAALTLVELLEVVGYQAESAHDGESALRQLDSFRPQLALLDISLPGMDGYELARQVRSRPDGAALRLVALTGYGQEDDRARARAAGFDEHLVKPVGIDQLTGTIERLLGGPG
ncbi:MAG: response regulator [Ramlibacter sp.]